MPRIYLTPLLALALSIAGCVERKQHITVEEDGTVRMEVRHETESYNELHKGDAIPSLAAGWLVEEQVETDAEGEKKYRLIAEAVFAPEVAIPANFAPPNDPSADLYLQFPTSVTIEDRRDGRYYHFARTYPGRQWAHIKVLEKRLLDDRIKDADLKGKKPEDMTHEERLLVIRAFAEFEVAKMLTFARAAFGEITPDAAQDGWLIVHRSLLTVPAELDYDAIAALLASDEEKDERDEALEAEAEKFEAEAMDRLRQGLRQACGYGATRLSRFMERYEWHQHTYEITQDLGDDSFEITVEMPGEIVGSNAATTDGNQVTWKFDGTMIRDRDLELLVSSRVPF